MTPITKVQRLLDLIAFLIARRFPVSIDQIMEGVPSYSERWAEGGKKERDNIRRIFQRDKEEIRGMGILVETVPFKVGEEGAQDGYRLQRGNLFLPYIKLIEAARDAGAPEATASWNGAVELTHAEAEGTVNALLQVEQLPGFPLQREARSVLRKLSFDLDLDAFPETPIRYVDPPGSEPTREKVTRLTGALQTHKQVQFGYQGIARGEKTEREVYPYGLVFQHSQWYMVGHDRSRDDMRVFRVSRMTDLDVNERAPHTADFTVPEGFTLSDHITREPWQLGAKDSVPIPTKVRFEPPASLWAEANDQGTLVRELPEGAAVREFEVVLEAPFLRWLLSFGGKARVEEPEELAEALREMAREVEALYGEATDG